MENNPYPDCQSLLNLALTFFQNWSLLTICLATILVQANNISHFNYFNHLLAGVARFSQSKFYLAILLLTVPTFCLFSHVSLFSTWQLRILLGKHNSILKSSKQPTVHDVLCLFSSVQFSCSVLSDSLWPHGLHHARPHCPTPTPRVSWLKLMSFESVMPSNNLILCHPLLLTPSIFLSIRGFSNESINRKLD